MWKHYVKTELRILRRQFGYTGINVAGLAIGIACCMLVFMYVRHELSYDRFHDQANDIYRLLFADTTRADGRYVAMTPALEAKVLRENLTEVADVVSFLPPGNKALSYGDKHFTETGIFYTTASVFDIFSFSLLRGNPASALREPNTMVLTERVAQKYFGTEDPLGKTLTLDDAQTLTVTGILSNVPTNSHLQFDILISAATLGTFYEDAWSHQGYTFVLVPGNVERLRQQLQPFYSTFLQARWFVPILPARPRAASCHSSSLGG